ncbi:FAD-dependent monooxygenase (plasmid) [Mycolicibacterium psychrotolerans]|uniref:FAD-dependent monooxygenase n=1 Tax=Mycolicibacterium psychrotolerans TaxID=216929 RepID=UPI003D67D743
MPRAASELDADVVIVGAGPVGLTLANLLGPYGVSVTILERHKQTVVESRAAVLDGESLRILSATGLGEQLRADMLTGYGHFSVTATGQTLLHVQPTVQPHGHPFLSWIHQPLLEQTLCTGLDRFDSVRVAFGHTVEAIRQDGDGVTVTATTSSGGPVEVTGRLVIGADGAASAVRQLLGIAFEGSTYEERWLVVDWEGDTSGLPGGSWFYADRRGPTISAKMPGQRRRWEFALRGDDIADSRALTDDYIRAMIARYTDPGHGTVARKTVYRFHDRQAQQWRCGRVVLAGDAAHVMPPFAGLGLNNGLRDAANLAWKIAAVCDGADPDVLLDSYEAERRPVVTAATRMAVRIGALTNARNRVVCAVRDGALVAANTTRWWRTFVMENTIEHWPHYRHGLTGTQRCRHTGALLPQPTVEILDSALQQSRLPLDALLRGSWTVVGSQRSMQRLTEAQRDSLAAAGVELLAWSNTPPSAGDQAGVRVIRDYDALSRWLGRHHDHLLLVRPDVFVYDCIPAAAAARIGDHLPPAVLGNRHHGVARSTTGRS